MLLTIVVSLVVVFAVAVWMAARRHQRQVSEEIDGYVWNRQRRRQSLNEFDGLFSRARVKRQGAVPVPVRSCRHLLKPPQLHDRGLSSATDGDTHRERSKRLLNDVSQFDRGRADATRWRKGEKDTASLYENRQHTVIDWADVHVSKGIDVEQHDDVILICGCCRTTS